MEHTPEPEHHMERLLLAGQRVAAGAYRNVETGCCVEFEQDGHLPPSFDGRVACYVPLPRTWRQQLVDVIRDSQQAIVRSNECPRHERGGNGADR
jgi:hypothetical protein